VSSYERPDLAALDELERLLHHVGDELAAWRRRSLRAEQELTELKARGGMLAGPELQQVRQRVADLEAENQQLRTRLEAATERVRALIQRLAFLERDLGEGAA
jgi:FtsZ-binding cell division protein ZapB